MAENSIDVVRKKFAEANNQAGYKVNGRDFQASDIVIINNRGRPKSGSTVTKKTYEPNYDRTTDETIKVDDTKGITKETKVTTVQGFSQREPEEPKFQFQTVDKETMPQSTSGGMISRQTYGDYSGNALQKPHSFAMTNLDKKSQELQKKSQKSQQEGTYFKTLLYESENAGVRFAKGLVGATTPIIKPVQTFKDIKETIKEPGDFFGSVGKELKEDPLGFAAETYGNIKGTEFMIKTANPIKEKIKTKYVEKTATFIPEEKLVKPEILSGKNMFPRSKKTPDKIVQEFKENIYADTIKENFPQVKNKDIIFHATPDQFPKNAKAIPGGSETPGTYGSSSVSTYFLRQGGEIVEPKGNLFENLAENTAESIGKKFDLIPKSEKPAIHPIAVEEVSRIPKNIRKNPIKAQQFFGYEPINPKKPFTKLKKFNEKQINEAMIEPTGKKGSAYVSPQYEYGVKDEIESILIKGSELKRLEKVKRPSLFSSKSTKVSQSQKDYRQTLPTRLTGIDTFTKVGGKVVRIKVLEAVPGESVAKMPKSARSKILKESKENFATLKKIDKNPYEYYNPKAKSSKKPVSAIFSGKAEPNYESYKKVSKSSQKVGYKPYYKQFETKIISESKTSMISDGSRKSVKPSKKEEISFKIPEKVSYGSQPKPYKPEKSLGFSEPKRIYSFSEKSNKKFMDSDRKENKKEEQQMKRQSFAVHTSKQEKKYTPTLYSATLGIKQKSKKTSDLTGLEVRPI